MAIENTDRFLLEQKITPLVNRYEYFTYADGKKGERVAFVQQKRFKLREEITAWTGESQDSVLFTLKAEKVFDVHGKFIVTAGDGARVGYLKKAFGQSLLRSTWEIYAPDDRLLFKCTERNVPIALLRRFGEAIPVVGGFMEFLPFNFDFLAGDAKAGEFNRVIALKDTYDLRLEGEGLNADRRLVLALGLALDALQAR